MDGASLDGRAAAGAESRRRRIAGALFCAAPAAYFGAATLYGCLHGADYASATPQLVRYVVAPGLLSIFFAGCALFLPATAKLLVGLNGSALLLALFAFELFMASRVIPIHLGNLGQMDEADRTAGEPGGVLPGYGLKGMNRIIQTTRLSEAVLGGIPRQGTLLCTRDGTPISFVADRFGFNNPDHVYDQGVDLIVLGDSFREGICLRPGQDVVSRLRETHPGSVGLATRGNGPLLELATLHRHGRDLRPKHVVLAFFEGNDWRNFGMELQVPWLRSALDEGAEFGEPPAPEASIAKVRQASEVRGRRDVGLMDLLSRTKVFRNMAALNSAATALGLAYPRVPKDHPEFAAVLAKANDFARRRNAALFLLYIPQADRYLGLLPHDFVMDQLRGKVLAAAEQAGVEVIDLAAAFHGAGDAIHFYQPDGHFNEAGASFAAQAIAARVGPGRLAAE
jgi:hypothetical protein